jgi:pyruvate dehydrogenase E2 component (dihydrolipoamide acetyltransferase)
MPKLGWTMEAGSLVEWLKRDGDPVRAGEIIFSVESDKAVCEVEALETGILRIPPDSPPAGEQVPVGAVLAYLVQPGEAAPIEAQGASAVGRAGSQPSAVSQPTTAIAAVGRAVQRSAGPAVSPRARRVAAELGMDWSALAGSGKTGRVLERDVRAATTRPRTAEIRVSPLARRLAEEAGVDLAQLASRTEGKRITREAVEAAIRERSAAAAEPVVAVPAAEAPELEVAAPIPAHREPLSTVRRVIRDRMAEAARTSAAVTLMADADATELVALRTRLVSVAQTSAKLRPPTYNDLLVRLVACALREHRDLNSSLDGDTLIRHGDVHVGLAVDTPRGLLVPVIRDAHRKGVWSIAEEAARIVEQALSGAIAADDLRGSTFTITNLGGLDVNAFTPILNLPDCAILGVGKIAPRPVVDASGERIVARQTVTLSLTFDHRVVDGAPAARFLQTIKRFIEEPLLWLAS